jgi:hypothetical protein
MTEEQTEGGQGSHHASPSAASSMDPRRRRGGWGWRWREDGEATTCHWPLPPQWIRGIRRHGSRWRPSGEGGGTGGEWNKRWGISGFLLFGPSLGGVEMESPHEAESGWPCALMASRAEPSRAERVGAARSMGGTAGWFGRKGQLDSATKYI